MRVLGADPAETPSERSVLISGWTCHWSQGQDTQGGLDSPREADPIFI